MKRQFLPFTLILGSLVTVYACSSSSSTDSGTNTNPEAGTGEGGTTDGGPNDDSSSGDNDGGSDSSIPSTGNPIEGIAAPSAVAALNAVAVVGPQWHADGLYYAELKKDGMLIKLTPPSTTAPLRGPLTAGNEILGTTFNEKTNTFVTCEVQAPATAVDVTRGGQLVKTPATGAATPTAVTLSFDAGATFDSPKNVVARKSDGMLYITDPGYQTQPQAVITTNHIWRVSPTGSVFELPIDGRPNGIAFSPDQKLLYVSFTDDPPKVSKFVVNADGSLGTVAPFATATTGSKPDGVQVDASGNVYVATTTGVDVYKPDGTKWGQIPTAKPINGIAFGGADKKTLYMATDTVGVFEVQVKIPGLL